LRLSENKRQLAQQNSIEIKEEKQTFAPRHRFLSELSRVCSAKTVIT
jgi:hypothetical protein